MTRLTAAAWMIEDKSSRTGPEVLEKLQQQVEVTEVWACFGHALYVTVIVLRVNVKCSREQVTLNRCMQTQLCYTLEPGELKCDRNIQFWLSAIM